MEFMKCEGGFRRYLNILTLKFVENFVFLPKSVKKERIEIYFSRFVVLSGLIKLN